jgi:hypothetical protein
MSSEIGCPPPVLNTCTFQTYPKLPAVAFELQDNSVLAAIIRATWLHLIPVVLLCWHMIYDPPLAHPKGNGQPCQHN